MEPKLSSSPVYWGEGSMEPKFSSSPLFGKEGGVCNQNSQVRHCLGRRGGICNQNSQVPHCLGCPPIIMRPRVVTNDFFVFRQKVVDDIPTSLANNISLIYPFFSQRTERTTQGNSRRALSTSVRIQEADVQRINRDTP